MKQLRITVPLRSISLVIVLLCSGCASQTKVTDNAPLQIDEGVTTNLVAGETGLAGWREAVITTANAEPWIEFLQSMAGWQLRSRSSIDKGLYPLWNLPEEASGSEYLFINPGTQSGFIRLVRLAGIEQDWIRADDRPWDTGGIFDLNMRIKDIETLRPKMLAAGWQGDSEPIRYTFGPFEVIEWIARGPDGVRIAFIERLAPALEGWPHLKAISRAFNSTQIVADMASTRHFYQSVLGMKVYLEHKGASERPGPNVLGLPHEMAATVEREVYVLHPDGINEGSVEILSFHGASGIDLSERAKPHNKGLSVLRFPVDDLARTMKLLEARGAVFEDVPVRMTLAPYGEVMIVAITAPEGARLEIFAPVR